MNREQYIKYINEPNLLNNKSLEDIRILLDEFPYFQTAWLLYAQNLKSIDDVRFESQLKQAAVRVTDRSVLFNHINTKPSKIAKEVDLIEEKPESKEEKNLEDIIKERLEDIQNKEISKSDEKKNYKSQLEKHPKEITSSENDTSIELLDFAFDIDPEKEQLDQLINSEIQIPYNLDTKNDEIKNSNKAKSRKIDLIDKFIQNEDSGISKETEMALSTPLPDYKVETDDDFISDTLAKIYIKQGHFEKALSTYEKLSLKYPEKNIYFAAQIKLIKELIKKTT
jgi:tetratricopeptide (TPR) repeat protein